MKLPPSLLLFAECIAGAVARVSDGSGDDGGVNLGVFVSEARARPGE